MRIIAGEKCGLKLFSPNSGNSRPILDRVKESLFSVLYKYDIPADKKVADLFSGVGSMGLESLSRSAESVTFVEKDPGIIALLKRNIEKTGFAKASNIIKADAFKVGAPVGFDGRRYDIVFVDPPYLATREVGSDSALGKLLVLLKEQIVANGIVVVRAHKATELLKQYGMLKVIERRQWGNTGITILQQKEND